MQNRWLLLLLIAFFAIVTLLFYSIRIRPIDLTPSEKFLSTDVTITEPSITFVNPIKGAKEARVTIVEFSDFECTHCQSIQKSLDVVLRSFPNDVKIVWKNLPNSSTHPQSIPAAIAAHCADRQGKFWEYHDALFARQSYLSEKQYTDIASELKMDTARFATCVEKQDTLPIVEKDSLEGRALEIVATPTLFVGKEKIVGTATAEELIQIIQTQLDE